MVFIFDRSQADIDRVNELRKIGWENLTEEQKGEWLGGLRGCLNESDLKRIEGNITTVSQLLQISLQTNRDSIPAIPNTLYFQQMIDNVLLLRSEGFKYSGTPQVPDQPLNTYQKINDLEKILYDIYIVFTENNNSRYYTDSELYTGNNAII